MVVEKSSTAAAAAVRDESPMLVESKERPSDEFMAICRQLDANMDQEQLERAWRQYDTIGQQCVLEGSEMPWIACALYLSLWQNQMIGQEPKGIFPLSKLIRICNVSVLEFFEKLTKWVEMANAPRRLHEQVNRIQASLAVSAVVYKKFLPIFRRIFLFVKPPPSPSKGRKRVVVDDDGLHTHIVFETIWMLYLAMKKQFSHVGDDLMNRFHLLLCAVDFVHNDLKATGKLQYLNPEFAENLETAGETVLEVLCRQFEGVVLDAKHFRTHWWQPHIRRLLLEDDGIVANEDLTGFVANHTNNLPVLSTMYEEAMLKRGEMDERMFIPADISGVFDETRDVNAIYQMRRPVGSAEGESSDKVDADLLMRMSMQACLERLNQQKVPATPLSGKSYVISGDQFCPVTPLSSGMCNANKMAILLSGEWQTPGAELERIMQQCRDNPKQFIADSLRIMGDKLENKVAADRESLGPNFDVTFSSMIKQRRLNAQTLFYRFLEKIVVAERDRYGGMEAPDFSSVLNRAEVIQSVYACGLELLMFTYESERDFPWSIELLRLLPLHFYKVIELLIRSEPDLSREMVKHLNKVEERVLEELAWSFDSPLWSILSQRADSVPSSHSVQLSPDGYPRPLSAYGTLSGRYAATPMKIGTGAAGSGGQMAKRRLDFVDDDEPAGAPAKRFAAEHHSSTSATALFFRKVYYLASVRLNDLCDRVRFDERGKQRVWTLFEHVLRTDTSLMTGRHLDQNLMCCLYVIAKISKHEVSFHDIMYHYRHQPQAASRVYRRVLIDSTVSPAMMSDDGASRDSIVSTGGGGGGPKLRSASTLPVPGMGSAPPTPEPKDQDYADLIKYYNRVFVNRVEDFVKKLQPVSGEAKENGASIMALTAMPSVRCQTLSPRRTVAERVNVLPMPSVAVSPSRSLRYSFNRSPSKDLRAINTAVRQGAEHRPMVASYSIAPFAGAPSYRTVARVPM